jgi:CheY-like chemotaxis protein
MDDGKSILLVEDDTDARKSVAEALEAEGYRVSVACNGRDALRLLEIEHERPDVILLDLMMPEMDGWIFRGAQKKVPEIASIPVVVWTAYRLEEDAARQLAAAAFLTKPVNLDALVGTVDRVLEEHRREGRPPS